MRILLLILSFYFLTGIACRKSPVEAPIIHTSDSTISFLALGDSYTIGQSVSPTERFPIKTAVLLRNFGYNIGEPMFVATTGWTTGNLISALNTNPPANTYGIVTLLIGVNNQFQGRTLEEYRNEFTILLNRSVEYAGNRANRVFVLSIPDYSVTPFAQGSNTAVIAAQIDIFNAANKEITLSMGVSYIDITLISREGGNDNTLQANDGLHPSGKQYQRWAELLAPVIRSQLQ